MSLRLFARTSEADSDDFGGPCREWGTTNVSLSFVGSEAHSYPVDLDHPELGVYWTFSPGTPNVSRSGSREFHHFDARLDPATPFGGLGGTISGSVQYSYDVTEYGAGPYQRALGAGATLSVGVSMSVEGVGGVPLTEVSEFHLASSSAGTASWENIYDGGDQNAEPGDALPFSVTFFLAPDSDLWTPRPCARIAHFSVGVAGADRWTGDPAAIAPPDTAFSGSMAGSFSWQAYRPPIAWGADNIT